jgi:hypothetical protein
VVTSFMTKEEMWPAKVPSEGQVPKMASIPMAELIWPGAMPGLPPAP